MNIMLYEAPCIIYSRYKKMRKQGTREDSCIIILSQLNNISQKDMKQVLKQEARKEKMLGFIGYMNFYRQDLNDITKEQFSYELLPNKV